jgi:hypothetical protein
MPGVGICSFNYQGISMVHYIVYAVGQLVIVKSEGTILKVRTLYIYVYTYLKQMQEPKIQTSPEMKIQ